MPHIHEKIDFTAEVFIVHKDKVLLRKHDKYDLWLGVGGHIELDEEPPQAAIREAKEEVGLDVELIGTVAPTLDERERELLVPRYLNRHSVSEMHEHITFIYFARSNSDTIVQSEDEKAEELHWLTAQDLENPVFEIRENIRIYALEALRVAANE